MALYRFGEIIFNVRKNMYIHTFTVKEYVEYQKLNINRDIHVLPAPNENSLINIWADTDVKTEIINEMLVILSYVGKKME